MNLICTHVDTCLPDYWGGHHMPWVAVPVHCTTTYEELAEAIKAELRMNAVQRADDVDDDWYDAAEVAATRMMEWGIKHGIEHPFRDLDPLPETPDDCTDSVYAYFTFNPEH